MLAVQDLNVAYEGSQVLWNVSFKVEDEGITTIVGANGSGKSTILKTISGLVKPLKGKINFDGEEITGLSPNRIVELGISHVPEGRRLFPYMSTEENLDLGAYTKRARQNRKKTIETVFNLFPVLKQRRNQLAGTLSGGEQQMLAVGRGLMSGPKLLVLDEVSLGLAPKVVSNLIDVVEKVARGGVTVLMVEQNVHLALERAKMAFVLETGRIVLEGDGKVLMKDEHVKKAYLGM